MANVATKRKGRAYKPIPCEAHPEPTSDAPLPQAAEAAEQASNDVFEGFLEGYGCQDVAECLIFYGWISRQGMWFNDWTVTVDFQHGTVSAPALVAFHDRPDLDPRGVGFVALVLTKQGCLGNLLHFKFGRYPVPVASTAAKNHNNSLDRSITAHAASLLSSCFHHPNLARMSTLLARRFVGEGYIDAYGYHDASAGWFITGWVSNDWVLDISHPVEIVAHFDNGCQTGAAVFNFFNRPDLGGTGTGIILHLSSQEHVPGQLLKLLLTSGESTVSLRLSESIKRVSSEALASDFAGLIITALAV